VIGRLFRGVKEETFKERVEDFWRWFPTVAERLDAELKARKSVVLAEEISARVDKLGPGFAWEVGPGRQGNSLTLSGEADRHRQLLTQYWVQRAPEINGWKFYPARQPDPNKGLELNIGKKRFDGKQIWVSPTVDREREKFDLAVWHPGWEELDDNQRWTMLFLFLDMELGEYGTQQWIGRIEFSEGKLKEAIGLEELPRFITETCSKERWESRALGEGGVLYRLEPHDGFARGDVVFLRTSHPRLIEDYLQAQGQMEDPLAGTGADYVYVTLSIEHLPKGEEVAARAVLEDALDERLGAEGLGRFLGGATGSRFGYIDLLIFDGERSVAGIEKALREANAPRGMQLHYFAKGKERSRKALT
jgi:hypothetical protein